MGDKTKMAENPFPTTHKLPPTMYEVALNTNLGDYLNHVAAKSGATREELEDQIELVPIRVTGHVHWWYGLARNHAEAKFNEKACGLDAVVELREGLSEVGNVLGFSFFNRYTISGTGIKFIDDKIQEA